MAEEITKNWQAIHRDRTTQGRLGKAKDVRYQREITNKDARQ